MSTVVKNRYGHVYVNSESRRAKEAAELRERELLEQRSKDLDEGRFDGCRYLPVHYDE